MRIIIIGGTGTIGSAVSDALAGNHDVVQVGSTRGDAQIDLTDKASIADLFASVGRADAVVSCAGSGAFGPFHALSDDEFALGLRSKLMGQVNLVRVGLEHLNDAGSFTLTSGIFGETPIPGATALAMVNGAVNSFGRAAALDMPRGIRINVVAPPWVKETLEAMGMDSAPGMPAADVAKTYVGSVEGSQSGEVLLCQDFA